MINPHRSRIVRSKSFKAWKKQRLKLKPRPKTKDLFRAYQIDKSLKATLASKQDWKRRINRLDTITIDYPKKRYYTKKKK